VAPLPAERNGYVTFGCVQNLTKINDYTLNVWKRVFDAVPQAHMRIQAPQFADMKAKDDFQMRLANLGFDTLRITLLPPAKRVEYLEKMADVDFMLDTFPYPGGTTTCEALWMGVPTLTMAGSTLLGRQGASLLSAGGCPIGWPTMRTSTSARRLPLPVIWQHWRSCAQACVSRCSNPRSSMPGGLQGISRPPYMACGKTINHNKQDKLKHHENISSRGLRPSTQAGDD